MFEMGFLWYVTSKYFFIQYLWRWRKKYDGFKKIIKDNYTKSHI